MPSSATKSVTSDGLDQGEHLRLVRAEQQAGEEVCGDRGEPEPPGGEPENARSPTVTASSLSVMAPFSLARPG